MHLISQRECAARLNCTTRTIRNMIADGRLEAVDGRVVETSLDRLLTAGDDAASEDLGRESPGEPRPVHPWVAKVENAKADFETLKIGAASRDFMAARAEQHAPSGPTLEDLHR